MEYLQVPKVRRYYKTTNSRHWMNRYPNLISNLVLNRSEQVWVADITYLRTKEKTYYLHLLTDACSKKIVGYQLSDNLMSSTTVKALEMAFIDRKTKNQLIHHSDRGLQYCSNEYTDLLKKNNIRIHISINMITPNQAHQQKTIHLKQWKKINRNRINSVTI
ncbi:DDE-type integrase/transposase/recombinase [Flavobacterium sp. LMO8]|uniref:DDE-type integrase/transposase/recombinase n=1 Tax=Flavobacterium sp. LMO8 TaxID=2654244 RepID=UPI00129150FD|nr:DDE-type integrase/transposase/recombinase [Flavobacterium sp. LMO8]MQP24129.1 DDE-type integrase/transposase/recombinase [Flavobacterium sp. LMO8]MQP24971.1 DDE-type integrase/transposase/recombinase [Flavobacterium sp. LMO8]